MTPAEAPPQRRDAETITMSDKSFVIGGTDGWLNVKREPAGIVVALPEFVQVEIVATVDGRDVFASSFRKASRPGTGSR
jgi:hypothetical protein